MHTILIKKWAVLIIFMTYSIFVHAQQTYSTPGPEMKLQEIKPPSMLTTSPDIRTSEMILSNYREGLPPSVEASQQGMALFLEAYDLTSVFGTFTEEVGGVPWFSRFNAVSGELGLLFALHKYSSDIDGESDNVARLQLSKGLMMYSLGKWGSHGIKVANIGIFFIDYSLTKFGEKGLVVREERYQRMYDNYNLHANPYRKTHQGWVNYIVLHTDRQHEFKDIMEKELNRYLQACFNDEGSMIPDEVRKVLVQKERLRILEIIKPAVDDAMHELTRIRQQEIVKRFNEQKEFFNTSMQIRVHVSAGAHDDKEAAQKIVGLPVRVVVAKDQHLWQGLTAEGGQWWFNCTWFGYIYYKKPVIVEVDYQGKTYRQPLEFEGGRFKTVRFNFEKSAQDTPSVHIIDPVDSTIKIPKGSLRVDLRFVAKASMKGVYDYIWDFGTGLEHKDAPNEGQESVKKHSYVNITKKMSITLQLRLQKRETGEILATTSKTITFEPETENNVTAEGLLKTLPQKVITAIHSYDPGWGFSYISLTPSTLYDETLQYDRLIYTNSKNGQQVVVSVKRTTVVANAKVVGVHRTNKDGKLDGVMRMYYCRGEDVQCNEVEYKNGKEIKKRSYTM